MHADQRIKPTHVPHVSRSTNNQKPGTQQIHRQPAKHTSVLFMLACMLHLQLDAS